jgi:hypothetical protein
MGTFEEAFEKACATREIPGVILLASDVTGEKPSILSWNQSVLTTPLVNSDTNKHSDQSRLLSLWI